MADRRQERKNPVRKPNSRKPELDPISNERDSVMRWSIRFKVLALAAVAALLLGLGGCDPGQTVWRACASPSPPQHAEAAQ